MTSVCWVPNKLLFPIGESGPLRKEGVTDLEKQ